MADTTIDMYKNAVASLEQALADTKAVAGMNKTAGQVNGAMVTLMSTWAGAGIGKFAVGKEGIMWGSLLGSMAPLGYFLWRSKRTK